MLESVFNKVAGLNFFFEYCKILKSRFLHKTPPVAAFKKFINLIGKHLA